MESDILIKDGNSNPLFSHTLYEFIAANRETGIPTYDKFCFQEFRGGIRYVVKNVLDDYMRELSLLATTVYLSNDELMKYNYKPKELSADLYGTTDLYYLILKLNGICNVKEFHDINPIKLLTVSNLNEYLTDIYSNEDENINIYNSQHL